MQSALVIGGTGPTGPLIVDGLADRGYDVSILHGGQHEAEFRTPDVRHIHADPHFAETLAAAIGNESYDVVLAQYGRLAVTADFFAGRTERLIAVGAATAIYAPPRDPRWGVLGRPALFPDTTDTFVDSPESDKLRYKMRLALQSLLQHDADDHYSATYVGYTTNYGPRQPGPVDWAVVRRVLDGRSQMVIADGGMKLQTSVFVRNAAAAVLRVVDHPGISRGKRYSVADECTYTMKQRIQAIATYLNADLELVDMPYHLAWPCHPLWRFEQGHRLCQSGLIRTELGFQDEVSTEQGIRETVDWLLANRPSPGGEPERQIGDPFDYDAEDRLIRDFTTNRDAMPPVTSPLGPRAHIYRHPKQPGEQWSGPTPVS